MDHSTFAPPASSSSTWNDESTDAPKPSLHRPARLLIPRLSTDVSTHDSNTGRSAPSVLEQTDQYFTNTDIHFKYEDGDTIAYVPSSSRSNVIAIDPVSLAQGTKVSCQPTESRWTTYRQYYRTLKKYVRKLGTKLLPGGIYNPKKLRHNPLSIDSSLQFVRSLLSLNYLRSLCRKFYTIDDTNTDAEDAEVQTEMVALFSPETQIVLVIEGICHLLWGITGVISIVYKLYLWYGWRKSSRHDTTVTVPDIVMFIVMDNFNLLYEITNQFIIGGMVIGVSHFDKLIYNVVLNTHSKSRRANHSAHSTPPLPTSINAVGSDTASTPSIVSPGTNKATDPPPPPSSSPPPSVGIRPSFSSPPPHYRNTTRIDTTTRNPTNTKFQHSSSSDNDTVRSVPSVAYTTLSILKETAIPYVQSGCRSTLLTLLAVFSCFLSCTNTLVNCYHSNRHHRSYSLSDDYFTRSLDLFGECKSPMDIGNIAVIFLALLYAQASIAERYSTYYKHGFWGIVLSTVFGMVTLHVLWLSGAHAYGSRMMYYATQAVNIAVAYIMIHKVANRCLQVTLIVKRYEVYEGTTLIDRMLHSQLLNKATKQAIDKAHDINEEIFAGLLNPLREDIHAVRALTDEVLLRGTANENTQQPSPEPSSSSSSLPPAKPGIPGEPTGETLRIIPSETIFTSGQDKSSESSKSSSTVARNMASISHRVNHIMRLLDEYNQQRISEIDADILDTTIHDKQPSQEKSTLRLFSPYTPLVSPQEDILHSPSLDVSAPDFKESNEDTETVMMHHHPRRPPHHSSRSHHHPYPGGNGKDLTHPNDPFPDDYADTLIESPRIPYTGSYDSLAPSSASTKPQYNWLLMDHDDRLESECPFEYGFERQYLRRKPHWKWWRAGPGRTSAVLSSARVQSLASTSLVSPHPSNYIPTDHGVRSGNTNNGNTELPADKRNPLSSNIPSSLPSTVPTVRSTLDRSGVVPVNDTFPTVPSTMTNPLPPPVSPLPSAASSLPFLPSTTTVSSGVSPVISTVMQTAGISMHDAPTIIKGGTITDASTVFLGAAAAAEKENLTSGVSSRRSSTIAGFPVADPRTIPTTLTGTFRDIPKTSVALSSAATAAANAATTSLGLHSEDNPSIARSDATHPLLTGGSTSTQASSSSSTPLLSKTDSFTMVPKTAAALAVAAVTAAADASKQRNTEYLEEGELPFVERSMDSKLHPSRSTTSSNESLKILSSSPEFATTLRSNEEGTSAHTNLSPLPVTLTGTENTTGKYLSEPSLLPPDNRKYAGLVARHWLSRAGGLDSESENQLNTDLSSSVNTAILSYRNKFLDQNNGNNSLLGPGGIASSSALSSLASSTTPSSSSSMNLGLHVLIVDDEVVNRKIAGRMLKTLGCTYESIEDGDVIGPALALSNKPFDVILLDIIMKRSNGLEICRSLRDQSIDIPIIAATANYSPREAAIYRAAGFTRVLQKPFDQQALGTVLIQALGIKIGQRASLGMKVT